MKPSTYLPGAASQIKPTSTTDVKTYTIPAGCSAVLIGVETTDARITFDGTDPSATNGLVYPKALAPVLVPIGPGSTIKAVATSAATSTVGIVPLS